MCISNGAGFEKRSEQEICASFSAMSELVTCVMPTRGAAAAEDEVQPFYVNAPYGITFVHNGNLTNTSQLEQDLFKVDRRHTNSSSDTEMLVNVLATEI